MRLGVGVAGTADVMLSQGRVWLVSALDDRAMYAEYFRHHALDVEEWNDPDLALHALQASAPDVFVIDFGFPGASATGPAFIQSVRERVDAATSIIVVSGYGREADRERARDAGADRFLIKPALPRDVLYEIRRALASRSDGMRLSWNWTLATRRKLPVARRVSSVREPLSLAADVSRK